MLGPVPAWLQCDPSSRSGYIRGHIVFSFLLFCLLMRSKIRSKSFVLWVSFIEKRPTLRLRVDGLCEFSEDDVSYSFFKGWSGGCKKSICARSNSAGCRGYLEVSWSSRGLGVHIRVSLRFLRHKNAELESVASSSNKMPAAVKSAIQDAIQQFGGYSAEDAVRYVEKMIQEGRLIEECWS